MRTLDQDFGPAGAPADGPAHLRTAVPAAAPRTELDALAMRAAAANGFGAGDVAAAPQSAPRGMVQRVADRAHALLEQWRAARRARAERLELAQVDSATLRDLGLEAADPQRLYAALAGTA